MMSIFSDMIEEIMEVFMDDFSVYGKLSIIVLKIRQGLTKMPRE